MEALLEKETFKEVLSFQDIVDASKKLKGVINETELIYSPFFTEECDNQVYLKPENLQYTGAYKLRGAYNKISKLTEEEKRRGIIASSAGNHAQGVAYAARELGVKATIVMPKTTPLIKVDATRKYGAEVVLSGDIYDDAYNEAKRLEKKHGYVFVHPFNDHDVMAGQGTIGIEIMKELKDVDVILVPVGGGGLISGISVAAKSINPNVKVIGVEPDGACAMKVSMDRRELTALPTIDTIADGVAVRVPGKKTYSIVKDFVDDIITVSDFELMESFLILLERHKLISETAGVLSLAALKKLDMKDKKVVSVISGGNIDVVTISTMINRGLISRGRLYGFSVDLPDTPGELLKISQLLSDLNANVVKLDHNQFAVVDRFKYVNLVVTIETNGHEHLGEIQQALRDAGYTFKTVQG